MIEETKKREILAEILNSSVFTKSKSYKKLLTYLVEQSIRGIPPKEYSIAVEVFGKEADFNPNDDPTIRVYVGNLRKKLKSYYNTEGRKAKIRIDIPTGHYEVRFVEYSKKRKKDFFFSPVFLLSCLVGLLLTAFIVSQVKIHALKGCFDKERLQTTQNPIWNDIVHSDFNKLVVLGDDFFFLTEEGSDQTIMRKHNVNSEEDLNAFIAQNRSLNIVGQTPYVFVPWISLLPLSHVLKVLGVDGKWSITSSSQLTPGDLLTNDIIFLGSFRNLYFLNQAFKDGLVEYKLGAKESLLTIHAPDSVHTFAREGLPNEAHTDYCLVRKIHGPSHNALLLFISFFESGIYGAADYMTNEETLQKLVQQFEAQGSNGQQPKYFDIVFKTTGYSRTMLTTQVVYMKEIDEKSILW